MNTMINSLHNQNEQKSSERVAEALFDLNAARTLRRNRRAKGIDHVELYYKDLDGDWLEQWAKDEAKKEQETERVSSF